MLHKWRALTSWFFHQLPKSSILVTNIVAVLKTNYVNLCEWTSVIFTNWKSDIILGLAYSVPKNFVSRLSQAVTLTQMIRQSVPIGHRLWPIGYGTEPGKKPNLIPTLSSHVANSISFALLFTIRWIRVSANWMPFFDPLIITSKAFKYTWWPIKEQAASTGL